MMRPAEGTQRQRINTPLLSVYFIPREGRMIVPKQRSFVFPVFSVLAHVLM